MRTFNFGEDYPNDVEHFRPKGKVIHETTNDIIHWYWFLAFNPTNYRFSCEFSNRKTTNPETGVTGGKGDDFPLLSGSTHAVCVDGLDNEEPILLDPCNIDDTKLLAFSVDGCPIIAPDSRMDVIAKERVDKSKLLLNLNFPSFNEEREALYNKIKNLVERGDRYIQQSSDAINDVIEDLKPLMDCEAEYSKAAECYIRCFRDRPWVDDLFS